MTNRADKLLAVLGEGGELAFAWLCARTGLAKSAAGQALGALCRRGLAQRTSPGRYRITDEGRAFLAAGRRVLPGPHARSAVRVRRDTLRGRLWRAARMRRKFTAADLVQLCGAGTLKGAQRYLLALERAGYLKRLARLPGAGGAGNTVRWALLRDTGSLPPVLNKAETAIYDPNRKETHRVA